MRLPDFLIIGAQKSGTTWLNWNLRQHPQVFSPELEVHFFDTESNYDKGIEWYAEKFAEATNQNAVGEKTPDYLTVAAEHANARCAATHVRIHNDLPDAKLIVVLRNPVDRAVSAVFHMLRTGILSPTHNINDLLAGNKRHLVDTFGVIDYGRYADHLKQYLSLFPKEQLLVLIYEEDVNANPTRGLEKTCRFLGIDDSFKFSKLDKRANAYKQSLLSLYVNFYTPFFNPVMRRVNKLLPVYKPSPTRETTRELERHYGESNEELFELIGRPIPSWCEDGHSSLRQPGQVITKTEVRQ